MVDITGRTRCTPGSHAPRRHAGERCHTRGDQPRPTNGILVAITVMDGTFLKIDRLVMNSTAPATSATSIIGSVRTLPSACGMPRSNRDVKSVAAFPTSICPQAMSYARPSSDVDLVRPEIACLVTV